MAPALTIPTGGDSFESQEAAVLSWLLKKPGIADAVQLALVGREVDAAPALVSCIRNLLQQEDSKPPLEESDPSTSKKRRRLQSQSDLPRCICVIMCGLHGSGKSTLCKMLREVLGGMWLDHDTFAAQRSSGRHLQEDFARELRAMLIKSLASADFDKSERLIFIDRVNSLRKDRNDIFQELQRLQWQSKGGKIVLVEMVHEGDAYGQGADGQVSKRYGKKHISLCMQRIEERGVAHPFLRPSSQLCSTLETVASLADSLDNSELSQINGRVTIEVSKTPLEMAMVFVQEMTSLKFFERPSLSPSHLRAKFDVAWKAHQSEQVKLQSIDASKASTESRQQWLAESRKALEHEKARAEEQARQARAEEMFSENDVPVPLYWKLDLPEVSKVLSRGNILPAGIVAVEQPHTTLLYLGGDNDTTQLAQLSGIAADELAAMQEALEALQGEEFELHMTEIIVEENVVSAIVSLPPVIPCQNKIPHITLGTRPGVPARFTNEVLEEVKVGGRTEGIEMIKLPKPRPLKGRVMLHHGFSSKKLRGS